MNLTDALNAIQSGDMDDYLDTLGDAIRRRRKIAALNIKVGARVVIRDNISPKYLAGITGEVTAIAGSKVKVQLDEFYRGNPRYRRYVDPTHHTLRLPADLVSEIT